MSILDINSCISGINVTVVSPRANEVKIIILMSLLTWKQMENNLIIHPLQDDTFGRVSYVQLNMMTSSNENIFALLAICAGNSPHQGLLRRALMFSLIWINGWVNNREAGDLRRHRAHCDVIVLLLWTLMFFHCRIYVIFWLKSHKTLLLGPSYLGHHCFRDRLFVKQAVRHYLNQ